MTAPSGSIFGIRSSAIEEIINKSVDVFLPAVDPAWRGSIASSAGVVPTSQIGRDLSVIKVFQGGLTGVFEPGGGSNYLDFPLYGNQNGTTNLGAKLWLQGNPTAFPSANEGANQRHYRLKMHMRSMVGNIKFDLGEMQADALDAVIGQIMAPKLEGFARNIALSLCNYWYVSQNSLYSLSAIGSAVTGGPGPYTITFSPTNYAINRYAVGQRVDIYNSSGSTRRNLNTSRIPLYVTKVDKLNNTVELTTSNINGVTVTDPATWSLASTDVVVLANAVGSSSTPNSASPYFTGIAGINSWLKPGDSNGTTATNDNTLLGLESDATDRINVNTHPEFKSMSLALGGNPLTEHKLRQILRRWHVSHGMEGRDVDYVVASDGVWLAYEATKIGQYSIDRTNRLSNLSNQGSDNSMTDEVTYVFDGKKYTFATSSFIESGTVYAYKRGGGNIKRMVPPMIPGTKKFDQTGGFAPFEFVGGLLSGSNSNYVPIYEVSGSRTLLTDSVQMPGMMRMQVIMEQPNGIKMTGVAEDRTYSDV